MATTTDTYLSNVIETLQRTRKRKLDSKVEAAIERISKALLAGKPLLICGNGGSASDALHIAGELVGRFNMERPGLKAIALSSNPSILTAWANDYDFDTVFSRQVEAYGEARGVLLGISTSGNSKNVVMALETARKLGLSSIGLTGEGGGAMAALCDILIDVPSKKTPAIQEIHICLYHFICQQVEQICADKLAQHTAALSQA